MGIKERWKRFQEGPSPVPKVIEFPSPRTAVGLEGKQKARIDNLRDEEARLERKLSDVKSNPTDREKRKEVDVVVERLVKIKYEIGIRLKLLER